MSPAGFGSDRAWAARLVVAMALVVVLGLLSVDLAPDGSRVAAWWPAAGVSVAITLWTRRALIPVTLVAILLASGSANWMAGRAIDLSVAFGVANATEAAVVALAFGGGLTPPALRSGPDFTRLVLGTALGALAAGAAGGLAVSVVAGGDFLTTARAIVSSHGAAVLLIVPLFLVLVPRTWRCSRLETLLQPAMLAAVVLLAFGTRDALPLAFLPMPVLAWGAARFGVRVAAAELLLTGTAATLFTTNGLGPFAGAATRMDLAPGTVGTLLQADLVASALIALPLALLTTRSAVNAQRARATAEVLEGVLDAATHTAIIATDRDSTVTFFNSGAEHLLGWSAAEIVGLRTPSIWHDPAEIEARAAELGLPADLGVVGGSLGEGETSEKRDWNWSTREGQHLVVSMRISRRHDASGTCVGWLGIAEDVTRQRRVEESLRHTLEREQAAMERLAQLDQAKTNFLASVSHELRTPLTSVLGHLELLLDGDFGPVPTAQRGALDRMDHSARRLFGLIEELLTFSKIESGVFELRVRTTNLCDLVTQALRGLELAREAAQVDIVVQNPEAPVYVQADPAQLERVVTNLVSNALKFTPSGGRVKVAVSAHPDQAQIQVIDTGVGMDAQELEQVFTRFYRSPSAISSGVPGTGLGLSIVQAILELHAGTVEATSRPGHGSTFTVCLPHAPGVTG